MRKHPRPVTNSLKGSEVMKPNNPPCGGSQQIPVIACFAPGADEACRVYSALARLAVDDPELGSLPLMQALRGHAYDTFLEAFEVLP